MDGLTLVQIALLAASGFIAGAVNAIAGGGTFFTFSALIANAISNDGDALFPAIALAPRAAIMATVFSTIPALIVAYAFYFLAPGFLN